MVLYYYVVVTGNTKKEEKKKKKIHEDTKYYKARQDEHMCTCTVERVCAERSGGQSTRRIRLDVPPIRSDPIPSDVIRFICVRLFPFDTEEHRPVLHAWKMLVRRSIPTSHALHVLHVPLLLLFLFCSLFLVILTKHNTTPYPMAFGAFFSFRSFVTNYYSFCES